MAQTTPPPLFDLGPSALTRLMVAVAFALFLMVADARFGWMGPVRGAVAAVLTPLQWLALQPVQWAGQAKRYTEDLHSAQAEAETTQMKLVAMSARASQVEQLLQENQRLRGLLSLGERLDEEGQAAEVLYDATDPYTRRVVINKGAVHEVQQGSPVMDESGVLGQVTRVYPMVSEVSLLVDKDQVIPVLNTRSGVRGLAHGDPSSGHGMLDLRFITSSADVVEGDVFTTSGMDGVYPAGLPVAQVQSVEKRSDSPFLRIRMSPLASATEVRHVLVLSPVARTLEVKALEASRSSASEPAAPALASRVMGAMAGAIRAGAPASGASAATRPFPAPAAPAARVSQTRASSPAARASAAAAVAARHPAAAASQPARVRPARASSAARGERATTSPMERLP